MPSDAVCEGADGYGFGDSSVAISLDGARECLLHRVAHIVGIPERASGHDL
jgi:hypothetical protein